MSKKASFKKASTYCGYFVGGGEERGIDDRGGTM